MSRSPVPLKHSSSVASSNGSTKPDNVFYIWYEELCRRSKITTLSWAKNCDPSKKTILDFSADRLKLEDWITLTGALKLDTSLHIMAIRSRMGAVPFMDNINTIDKVRQMKQKFGLLRTDYVLKTLARALGQTFHCNPVLNTVQLEGLPLTNDNINYILGGLRYSTSIRNISFRNSPIGEEGCLSLCRAIEFLPTIAFLNLCGCDLTPKCGKYIGDLIRSHRLSRLNSSWHTSLRYNEPDAEKMLGLRRITLNRNDFGDYGLEFILNELLDDMWVKALDMQKCGISDEMGPKILHLLIINPTLQVTDFRNNDIDPETLDKFSEIMRDKQSLAKDNNLEAFDLIDTRSSMSQFSLNTTATATSNGTYMVKKTATRESSRRTSKSSSRSGRINSGVSPSKQMKKAPERKEFKLTNSPVNCKKGQESHTVRVKQSKKLTTSFSEGNILKKNEGYSSQRQKGNNRLESGHAVVQEIDSNRDDDFVANETVSTMDNAEHTKDKVHITVNVEGPTQLDEDCSLSSAGSVIAEETTSEHDITSEISNPSVIPEKSAANDDDCCSEIEYSQNVENSSQNTISTDDIEMNNYEQDDDECTDRSYDSDTFEEVSTDTEEEPPAKEVVVAAPRRNYVHRTYRGGMSVIVEETDEEINAIQAEENYIDISRKSSPVTNRTDYSRMKKILPKRVDYSQRKSCDDNVYSKSIPDDDYSERTSAIMTPDTKDEDDSQKSIASIIFDESENCNTHSEELDIKDTNDQNDMLAYIDLDPKRSAETSQLTDDEIDELEDDEEPITQISRLKEDGKGLSRRANEEKLTDDEERTFRNSLSNSLSTIMYDNDDEDSTLQDTGSNTSSVTSLLDYMQALKEDELGGPSREHAKVH